MSRPVAIVTGASSGIGLALTKQLLESKWHVVMADVNGPKEELADTLFIKTDISKWADQASLFQRTFEWHSRLDFCALNAGIDDRDDIFASVSSDTTKPPKQPNMKTIEVNLTGTYYGIKLAAHYMSLNKPKPGGKVVVTASAAGIYPLPSIPQYAASKHGLVGLVRSLAPVASKVKITINAICPAMVATGLAPPGLMDGFSKDQITPMSTIMRAFAELGDLENVEKDGWTEGGKTGDIVECSIQDLIYREAPQRANQTQEHMAGRGAADFWAKAYTERNKKFAEEDWMSKL